MSRTPFGKPEFRLAMDYPHITVTRHDARVSGDAAPDAPVRAYDLASPTLVAELRRLGAEIRAARGRLTVILPAGEVWRGRLALGEAKPRERGNIARSQAAQAMGLPMAALAVRLGRLDRDGTLPAAAVPRETLAETRAFLARAGLKPARITGAGAFEGFAEAPQLDTPPLADRLRPALPAAGGALAAAALVALLIRPGAAPEPEVALIGPMPLATVDAGPAEAVDAPVAVAAAEIAPRRRPADLVIVRAAPATPPTTNTATGTTPGVDSEVFRQGPVTMMTRNIDLTELPPERQNTGGLLRLAELDVARARMADTVSGLAQLRPGAVPAPDLPGALAVIRDVLSGTEDAPILSGASSVAPPEPAAAAAPATTPPAAAPRPVAAEAQPAAAPAFTAPRPPARPARQAAAPAPAPEPEPEPKPAVAAAEPAPAPAREPAAATTRAAAAIAPPPARPESAAESAVAGQVAQAVGAAVVAAGVEASTRTAAASAGDARPAPRTDFRPVRQAAAAPAVQRATPARQAAAAPQPARAATQATPRSVAQAPQRQQRVAAAQPARQAAAQPARQAAAQPARQVAAQPARQAAAQPARQAAAQPARQAAAQPARQARATPARHAAAQRPASNNATNSTTAAAAATQNVNLARRGVTLIGVFGPESDRYAMVRLSNGSVQRIKAGDQVQGAHVAAVGASTVQFANNGRTTTLAMP